MRCDCLFLLFGFCSKSNAPDCRPEYASKLGFYCNYFMVKDSTGWEKM
ncbi:hypothetical protein NSP_6040 [Nodularia spumigena CCY9414]|nr:hypothetical protein NSP_6040 [Nodularia spumigena CCY9414]